MRMSRIFLSLSRFPLSCSPPGGKSCMLSTKSWASSRMPARGKELTANQTFPGLVIRIRMPMAGTQDTECFSSER
jgi:hypothetical protein